MTTTLTILHGIWHPEQEGELCIWIESSNAPSLDRQNPFTALQETSLQQHPFAVPHEQLIEQLKEKGIVGHSFQKKELILALPTDTTTHTPHPSFGQPTKRSSVVHWKVPCLSIRKNELLETLILLEKKPLTDKEGASLRYWRSLSYYIMELIDKGSFYPTVELCETDNSYRARWNQAPLHNIHTQQLQKLVGGMPPLCRASVKNDLTPFFLVEHFIQEVLDASLKKCTELPLLLKYYSSDDLDEAPHEWLHQLTQEEHVAVPSLLHRYDTPTELFVSAVRTWEEPYKQSLEKALSSFNQQLEKSFKLLLQLQQPEPGTTEWHLTFSLQAADDPTFIISTEQLWQRSFESQELLRFYEDPEDRLLKELLRLILFTPGFACILEEQYPTALTLTINEVYTFLQDTVPLLLENGFNVQVPNWWNNTKRKFQSQVYIKRSSSSGLMSSDNILEYDWKISLGEQTFSEEEFRQLTALKEPLIKLKGEWITVNQQETAHILSLFEKRRSQQLSLMEALKLSVSAENEYIEVPTVTVSGEEWFEELMKHLKNPQTITPCVAPRSFCGSLRPYQERGLTWLSYLKQNTFGACLADDMGLGKTIQIIALLLHEKTASQSKVPHLLICPLSVLGNWQQELARFSPSLKVLVHHGYERLSGESFSKEALEYDLVLTTYALTVKDYEELGKLEWQSIILDEAHHIKNGSSKQSRFIKQLRSQTKIALTGTPVENKLSELWSLMDFLNKGYLGSEEQFHKQFTLPIERHNNREKAALLKNMVQPFILRRVKTDTAIIKDLPEKIETKELCHLTKEQASLYQSVLNTMLVAIEQAEGIERRGLILATLTKLKQVCNHPAHLLADNSPLAKRSGKLERLQEILDEVLEKGEKTLIFTQYAAMGKLLQSYLATTYGKEVLFLHGALSKSKRDTLLEQFQRPDGPALFVLSLKAGGVGLNLTQANHVIHFDRWWNPAVEDQATDRAFRIGQKKIVHVHKCISKGTVEERIDKLIEQKKELASLVITSGEHWITELSTQELKELFSLTF